jgi:hypothetical protein
MAGTSVHLRDRMDQFLLCPKGERVGLRSVIGRYSPQNQFCLASTKLREQRQCFHVATFALYQNKITVPNYLMTQNETRLPCGC